jgi:hypothetical protein
MLKRCRQRQRRVTLTSNGLVAAIVVSAIAVPLSMLLPASTAVRVGMLFACIGSFAAAILALMRTPPLRRIAAIADARLSLDDCLVTAFQFIDDPDVVSRLIVRDAAVRAAGVSPADVFPFHAPARIAWIVAAAVAASAMLTVMAMRQSAIEPALAGAAGPPSQAGSASAKASGNVSGPSASDLAVPSTADRAAVPSGQEGPRARKGVAESGSSNRVDASREMARAKPPDTNAGQAERSPDAGLSRIPPPQAEGAGSRGRSSMTSRELGGGGGTGSRGRSLSDAAGGVSAGGGRAQAVAGGLPGTSGDIRPRASALPEHDARFRESVGRAEAAVANERIPPGLRAYLKAYFTAINPR